MFSCATAAARGNVWTGTSATGVMIAIAAHRSKCAVRETKS